MLMTWSKAYVNITGRNDFSKFISFTGQFKYRSQFNYRYIFITPYQRKTIALSLI